MAIVKKYPAEVIDFHHQIENIYTVILKSLKGPFKYYPGQFLHLALDDYDPSMGWPESRCFSMQSCPKDEFLKITFAVKGAYTKRMTQEINLGKQINLKLPYGDLFTQIHNKENTVFIAGGTGITPLLSMFISPTFAEYKNPLLYVGFRSYSFNLYKHELKVAKKINSKLNIKYVFQNTDGLLDICAILNESDSKSSFFISGPPDMIKSFKNFLLTNDINENRILTDDWE